MRSRRTRALYPIAYEDNSNHANLGNLAQKSYCPLPCQNPELFAFLGYKSEILNSREILQRLGWRFFEGGWDEALERDRSFQVDFEFEKTPVHFRIQ